MASIPRPCACTNAKDYSSLPAPKAIHGLYTDEDLQRLEFILSLARDLGVNISGIAIILQMRERMEEMQVQIHDFVKYIQEEVLSRATAAADPSKGAIVPVRRHLGTPSAASQKALRTQD